MFGDDSGTTINESFSIIFSFDAMYKISIDVLNTYAAYRPSLERIQFYA